MTATITAPQRRVITPTQSAALAVYRENLPVGADWESGGGVQPAKSITDAAKRYGWPNRRVEIEMAVSSENPRKITGPATIVPEPWLRRIAEILELPWENACRGLVNPE